MEQWYDETIYIECLNRQLQRWGSRWLFNPDDFDFAVLPYDSLADMATVATELEYNKVSIEAIAQIAITYEMQDSLRSALNTEVYRRLHESKQLYLDYYDKYEKWAGDRVFSLMTQNYNHDRDCLRVLKQIVILKHLLLDIRQNRKSDCECISAICAYSYHHAYLGDMLDHESSSGEAFVPFSVQNQERKQTILNRIAFVRAVLEEQDYEKAYKMLFPIKEDNSEKATSVFTKM